MMRRLARFMLGTFRGRLTLSVAAVHAVMMAMFIGDLTGRQRAMLLDRQTEEATVLSLTLATSAAGWIAAGDISGLQELVEAQRRYPEILFAILADEEGRILATTDKSRQGLYLLDLPGAARQAVLARTPALVDIVAPAMLLGRHVGWARVGIGQKAARERLTAITWNGIVYALAAIVIGSAIAWSLGGRVSRRLGAVQKTIDAIRAGDPLARSSLTGNDETAVMAREFNAMLDSLADRDAALRTSEGRFRSLIQKVQTAIVLHDGQGQLLNSNPLAEELLGLSADQLQGKALLDLAWHFLREDGSVLPVAEYPVSQVLASGRPFKNQVLGISRPDREELAWVLVNAEPEYDGMGAIALVIVSFVDISERKQAEEALHQLNRELVAISNCNQVLVRAEDEQTLLHDICRIICDEAGYRMAWVGYAENDAAKTIRPVTWAGVEDGYLAGANLTWADTELGRGPSGTAIRTGKSTCIQDFNTDPHASPWRGSALQRGYRSSIALPLKDESAHTFGTLNIYSSTANTFTPEEIRLLGELAADLAFGLRVLHARRVQKRVEEALRESEARLKEAQRIAHLGHWELDLQKGTLYWSDEVYRMFGLEPQEFGATYGAFLERVHPEDRGRVDRAYSESVRNQTGYDIEHRLIRKDGEIRFVNERCATEYDPQGAPLRSLGTVLDITERKQTEEAFTQLNAELEQRVNQRTAELEKKNRELERLNRLFVGRELRMVELKQRIQRLEEQIAA